MQKTLLILLLAAAFPASAGDNHPSALSQVPGETGKLEVNSFPVITAPLSTLEKDPRFWIVVRVSGKELRTKIAGTGMAIEEVGPSKVAGIAHINTIKALETLGFEIEYRASLAEHSRLHAEDFPPKDQKYHDYKETTEMLQGLAKNNPEMASLYSIGKSVQGRDIWTLRLNTTASGTQPSDKPGAVYMGNHHAREHLSVEVPLLFASWLCENKEKPEVKKLLDTRDIYIMPMINPDGAEYDISDGEYKWQRKNMRVNPDKEIGVDLNRNYGYGWGGPGSSGSTWSDTYRGPYAFSEPETQAVKAFVESKTNLKTLISYHSFSELILYPWGGSDEPIANEKDRKAFIAMAKEMAKMTGYTPEQSSDLYVATGDTTDWTYAVKGIFSYTFELTPKSSMGGGFYPGAGVIDKVVSSNIKAAMYLLDMTDNPYRSIQQSSETASK